jgi:hypothetical protein
MASAVVDDWEQLADPEPEWDSDDFVPPPVGNASVTPAPVATPIVAASEPVEPTAVPVDAELEFARSLFGGVAISAPVTPAATTKDVRGGGRNRKHRSDVSSHTIALCDRTTLEEQEDAKNVLDSIKDVRYNRLNDHQKKQCAMRLADAYNNFMIFGGGVNGEGRKVSELSTFASEWLRSHKTL